MNANGREYEKKIIIPELYAARPNLPPLICVRMRVICLLFNSSSFAVLQLMKFVVCLLVGACAVSVTLPVNAKDEAPPKLVLPDTENFVVAEHPAFVFLPPLAKRTQPQPWIF